MRIFEGRYFNINRRLLMCLGLWPYEVKVKRILVRAIIIGTMTLLAIPQLIGAIVHHKNIDRLMLSLCSLTSLLVMISKVMGMILAEENMKALHRRIADNWQLIQDQRERDILRKYSERARTATIIYAALMAAAGACAPALCVIPKLLDIVIPLENPRPYIHVSEGEYFIDRETHFMLIFPMEYIGVVLIVMVLITVDTMYIVCVEHCCALYAIIGYRLSELKRIVQENSSVIDDGDSYEWQCRTIELHQNALTFVSLLDNSYSTTFLFSMLAGLFIIPLISCAIIANLHNSICLIPYVICLVVVMIHGFFIALPGQRIIDHELSLCDAAYCNEWYVTPLRTRKLLVIFMLRCSQVPTIRAGGLVPINFETYFKILKTSVSYITVVSSFR